MEQPLSPVTHVALVGSAVAGVAFLVLGTYGFLGTGLPQLFSLTLIVLGGLALVLSERARRRRRAPWAYLVAMWGVIAFCAFFTAPEVLELEKLKQVTVELELKYGAEKAQEMIADDNVEIRAINLGFCLMFAAPFVALCVCLAKGRRDYEQPA